MREYLRLEWVSDRKLSIMASLIAEFSRMVSAAAETPTQLTYSFKMAVKSAFTLEIGGASHSNCGGEGEDC